MQEKQWSRKDDSMTAMVTMDGISLYIFTKATAQDIATDAEYAYALAAANSTTVADHK